MRLSSTNLAFKINRLVHDIVRSYRVDAVFLEHQPRPFNLSLIAWKPPPEGSFKLNCDGAKALNGKTAYGGVLRNHCGEDIFSFPNDVWVCSVVQAELWAILISIKTLGIGVLYPYR